MPSFSHTQPIALTSQRVLPIESLIFQSEVVRGNDRQGLGEQKSEQRNKQVLSNIDSAQSLYQTLVCIPAVTLAGSGTVEHEQGLP